MNQLKRFVRKDIYQPIKLKKAFLFLFFASSFISCETVEKQINKNNQHKLISGNYFKNPEAEILNEEGINHSINGNYNHGKSAFLKSLKIEPDNPTTLSNLGLAYFLTDDYNNAIKYYQKSYIVSDSLYHIAAVNLGLTYFYKKEFNKGIYITNYVIKHTDDKSLLSSAYTHRALNFLGNNDCKKAQTDLKHIINNFQGEKNVKYNIRDLTTKIRTCTNIITNGN